MRVKIKKLTAEAKTPSYKRDGDAAFDLCSIEDFILHVGEKKLAKTGISLEIPKGFVGLIWDRSGLAANQGIHTLAGVIDSNYRGEVCVVMMNLGKEPLSINKHDRIAQMLIQPVHEVDFEESDELSDSHRGDKGFGSTGMK